MNTNPYSSPEAGGQPERKASRVGPALLQCIAVLGVIGLVIALLLPNVRIVREPARRNTCSNNLKNLGLAMHNYYDAKGAFPPAYIADEDGKPMHSWRVLILPYLQLSGLYDTYDQSQPWDSETNKDVLSKMPSMYQCPSTPQNDQCTAYVVVQGKETVFDADKPCPLASITDGAANTILIVEAPHANILWTEPRDLDFDQMSMAINGDANSPHSDHPGGANALFADGRVRFIQSSISAHDLRALLTKDAGDAISGSF